MSVSSPAPSSKKPLLSDQLYVYLKYTTSIALPAVGALYFALAQIWSLPKASEVVGSISVLNAFLGALLGVSAMTYSAPFDGVIHVENTGEGTTAHMVLNSDPETALSQNSSLTFQVNQAPVSTQVAMPSPVVTPPSV
jgi:hypothetical protein